MSINTGMGVVSLYLTARCRCDSLLVVEEVLAFEGEQVSVSRNNGRLSIKDSVALDVSVSHDGPHTLVATSRPGPVGVDIERRRSIDALGFSRRYFADREVRELEFLAPDQRVVAFFRMWTLKEAFGKMRGEGLQAGALRWPAPWFGADDTGGRFADVIENGIRFTICDQGDDAMAIAAPASVSAPNALREHRRFSHDCSEAVRVV